MNIKQRSVDILDMALNKVHNKVSHLEKIKMKKYIEERLCINKEKLLSQKRNVLHSINK